MATLFIARRRSGRIITMLPELQLLETMCRNLVTKKMHFLQEKKKPELKNSKCDLIEMMKVACKDESGDDVVDVDIERAMKPRWLHAPNLSSS
ncbi:unnamed protein product [Bathycoccus prasinos]